MQYAIECKSLVMTYPAKPPVEAVRGLDLFIRKGECFGLLGPNGAGKTTTLEILEGLQEPTSGEVRILGMTWDKDGPALREKTGISLQETKLSEDLTVLETVRMFASFFAEPRPPAEVIASISLESKARTQIGKLSGGQKQRVALACALVGNPEILFLDEPTTGLDPQSRRQVWELVQSYQAKGGTILLTTHYMDEAEKLCQRLAIIDHGKIIAQGSPNELIRSHGGQIRIEVDWKTPQSDLSWLKPEPPLSHVESRQDEGAILQTSSLIEALPIVLRTAAAQGVEISSIRTHQPTLEDVFVALTGRHLRDGEATP